MKRSTIYLILAIVGAVVPWVFFGSYFAAEGFGTGGFVPALFANGAAGGFAADLLISSVVFWIYLNSLKASGRLERIWPWVCVNLAIGLSCAFPLILWQMTRTSSPEM